MAYVEQINYIIQEHAKVQAAFNTMLMASYNLKDRQREAAPLDMISKAWTYANQTRENYLKISHNFSLLLQNQ